jgi:cytochrome c-type biogenesis protein CcmF
VHLGILIYFVGFTGQAFVVKQAATLKPGESVSVKSPFGHTYTFTHMGISQYEQLNRVVSAATLQVKKNGVPDGTITSEKRQHFTVDASGQKQASFSPSTEVGIRSDAREDVYVVFAGAVPGRDGILTEEADYRININPLIAWVWIGGIVLVAGGLITMWPGGGGGPVERREQAGYQVELVETAA